MAICASGQAARPDGRSWQSCVCVSCASTPEPALNGILQECSLGAHYRTVASAGLRSLQNRSPCAQRTTHMRAEALSCCLQAAQSGQGGQAGPQSQGPAPDVQRLCVLLAGRPAPPLVQAACLPEGPLSRGEPLLPLAKLIPSSWQQSRVLTCSQWE